MREELNVYHNDAYWLKFYYFVREVDMAVFHKLQAESTEHLKELDKSSI